MKYFSAEFVIKKVSRGKNSRSTYMLQCRVDLRDYVSHHDFYQLLLTGAAKSCQPRSLQEGGPHGSLQRVPP